MAISAIVDSVHLPGAEARAAASCGMCHLPDPLRLPRVVRAAQPDRRRGHALVTDGAPAFGAGEAGLAVRVAVARAWGVHAASVSACASTSRSRPRSRSPRTSASSSTSSVRRRRSRRRSRRGYERVLCCARDRRGARAARGARRRGGRRRRAERDRGRRASTWAPHRASSQGLRRRARSSSRRRTARARSSPRRPSATSCCSARCSTCRRSPRRPGARAGDVAVVCSGFKGTFALDDAYCAGRIVDAIGGEPSDAAIAALDARGRMAGSARRVERAHVRPARARGRHPALRAGGLHLGRPAFHVHERCRSGDTGGP